MNYDYIIIGGGPAGATAAYSLQKSGASCLILEREQTKKEKVCGGLLTWTGIRLLKEAGIDLSSLLTKGAKRILHFIVVKNCEERTYSYHAGEYGLGLRRVIFDSLLLNEAKNIGVNIQYGINVKKFTYENKKFQVGINYSKRLILASGARGYIVGKDTYLKQSFGLSAQILGKSDLYDDSVYFWYPDNSDMYVWCIPNGNAIWNIGIWFPKYCNDAKTIFKKYYGIYIARHFDEYCYMRQLTGGFCGNVDMSRFLPNNCFGIGDFAGFNSNSTGEGIRYAIESALNLSRMMRYKHAR